MKKPKDVHDLASRLMNAATTPLMVPQQAPEPSVVAESIPAAAQTISSASPKARKAVNRRTVSVFLRMHGPLFEEYDKEAVRRTKASGRGVTVQQVILEKLETVRPTA